MSTTSSKNFTTLYSGSGSVTPQGAYGNANVVSLLAVGTDGGNTVAGIVATGNVTTTSQMSAQGNITTAGYFVGSVVGNVSGNVTAAGSNTQVQFNNNGLLGADSDFTYNNSTNALAVTGNITGGNVAGTTVTGTTLIGSNVNGTQVNTNLVQGNIFVGNLLITNSNSGTGGRGIIVLDGAETQVGQDNAGLGTNATVRAIRNQALELTTTNAGAPAVYVGKYVSGNPSFTGNVDIRSSNVGGYAGTGNINLSGNVYVGRDAQGANTTYGKANLIVSDGIYTPGVISATGNITTDGFFVGNFTGNITGNLSVPGLNTEVLYNNSGNAGASSGFTFTAASNAMVVAGNITGGNIISNGKISSAGNIDLLGGYFVNIGNTTVLGTETLIALAGNPMYMGSYNTANTAGNALVVADGANGIIQLYSPPTLNDGWVFNTGTGNLTLPGNASAINYANGTSILSGLASTYGNANVSAYLASGTNSANIITTGNIAGGNLISTANVDVPGYVNFTTADSAVGGGLLRGWNGTTVALSSNDNGNTVANAVVAAYGSNGNVTISGNNSANAWTFSGATGNLTLPTNTAAINYANGVNILTSATGTYGNANVADFLANGFGSNTISTTGNVTTGNLLTPGLVSATGNVLGGNVVVPNGGRYLGDFSSGATAGRTFFQSTSTGTTATSILSVLPGPNHVAAPGQFGTATSLFSTNDTGNASIFGMYSYPQESQIRSTNTGGGNVNDITFRFGTGTTLAATITAAGLVSAVGNVEGANLVTAGLATVAGNVIGGNISSLGTITSVGNILGGNLILAPGSGAGNVNITTSQAYATVTTTPNPARIIIGSGYTGNAESWSVNYDPYSRMRQPRLLINDKISRGDGAINTAGVVNVFQQEFTANVTTSTTRNFAGINFLHVGGGANAYQSSVTNPAAFTGMNGLVITGTNGNVAVGNVTMAMVTGGLFGPNPNNGSTIGNAAGVIATMQPAGNTSTITNGIGFAPWAVSTSGISPSTVPTNYNVYYNPSNVAVYGGISNLNAYRASTNYYAFKNDDNVAQVQLGSLRSYNEYQYSTATSGTVNIDKNNAQIQFINPTANITIGDYQNFVTTANDSVNNDNQTDTVTLIIQQGSTPYTVTMPTGNASIKYANAISTIGTTANAVTMVSITAFRSAANATMYLTTVSPEFS